MVYIYVYMLSGPRVSEMVTVTLQDCMPLLLISPQHLTLLLLTLLILILL
jgi:hypothetical protein